MSTMNAQSAETQGVVKQRIALTAVQEWMVLKMAECIEKPDMQYILHIKSDKKVEKGLIDFCLELVVDVFENTEITADVKPVKRGHWYHNTSKYISELDAYFIQACCSCCGKYSDRVDSYSQLMSNAYCSHCSARMDGGVDG